MLQRVMFKNYEEHFEDFQIDMGDLTYKEQYNSQKRNCIYMYTES